MPIITKAPSAAQVYLMIAIGIVSMLIALNLLFSSAEKLVKKDPDAAGSVVVAYKQTIVGDGTVKIVQAQKPYSKQKLLFHNNPDFFVWIVFITLMVAVTSSLMPVLLLSVKDILRNFVFTAVTKGTLVFLTACLLALIMFVNASNKLLVTPIEVLQDFKILLNSTNIITGIVIYTLLVAMIAVYGQLSINHAIGQLPETIANLTAEEVKQKGYDLKFILLRKKLKFFLICLATLIVFSIITTELLRNAILKEIKTNVDIMPHSFVYIYGLVFTFFLAVLYLPVYYRLRQKGVSMLEIEEGLETEKEPVFKAFIIKETPMESLKITLSILAPILTTLIPNVKIF